MVLDDRDFFLAISNPFFTTWLAALAVPAAVDPMALPMALFPEVIARLEWPVASILPAPESSHAIYAAIEEAKKYKEKGEAGTILFGLTGTGFFDMTAYSAFKAGTMSDYVPTDEDLEKSLARLPKIPGIQE